MKEKFHLSGPLSSRTEIERDSQIKVNILDSLRDSVEVIWPHEIAAVSPEEIFQSNLKALGECKIMVAILDRHKVNDGISLEIGYNYARGGRIVGIRTDFKRLVKQPSRWST